MAYKEYNYGANRKEVKKLLRKRLMVKERVRYHEQKAEKWKQELPRLETKINKLLGERQHP